MPEVESQRKERSMLRSFSTWAATLILALAGLSALVLIVGVFIRDPALMEDLLKNHVRAVIGVPMASASAFCMLLVLEARAGDIKFHVVGVHFEGASGPAVIWIFAFLAFAAVIRMLW